MFSSKCVLLALVAFSGTVWARSAVTNGNAIPSEETARTDETSTSSYLGDFKFMYKVYQECAATDLTSCLKMKLITAMDRAARNFNQVPIFEGVSFVKEDNTNVNAESSPITEAQIEAQLPRSLTERDGALNNIIFDKVGNFLQTHTLQVKPNEIARAFNGEERGKKKKMGGLLLIPLILGGTLVPLALGALALLAGKALIVSKLALVLAGIIGLKKLLGGGGGGHESGHEVVVSGGHGHGSGWGRAYQKEEAQNIAYNAYAPKAVSS
ncbi:PREDICTED: uncharacterized protein LOC108566306 [Nicrophorus vespilloides]|uniref:Uncharacterized protein LOC108566306 n=1 Tax=Nicrophorus vespilloides TaxID=110193 RepID=A0ABM1N456_NICVS|nr:PREDICTED: uncharacterized protein LOC108566306 [Nicrophorus vespilloides]